MMQTRLIIAAVLLALGGFLAWFIPHHYREQGRQEVIQKYEEASKLAVEKLNLEIQANAEKERQLAALITAKDTQLYESNQAHEKVIKDYESKLRSGAERLSIAINRPIPTCSASADARTSSQSSKEERADIMPETAARILSIAGDAAKDVRDYNALVDIYNAARTACNASK